MSITLPISIVPPATTSLPSNHTPPCNQFELDSESGVWVHRSSRDFDYSDGAERESEILKILRSTQNCTVFSEQLQKQISDWPTQYHFSSRRHALLRHLNIPASASILELGAGCGAITRYLGECGADVWAVEGSRARAACVAARTRDLSNVRVLCGDFNAIEVDQQFDVVTLIGVLEYAPKYFKSDNSVDDPLVQCLKLAKRFLKPDGTLIVAIENQLGLKYFCGAPEDHAGKPFVGIQNLYKSRTARTCGKSELTALLKTAGFADISFEYPFPDYKLPKWILTQRAMNLESFDPCPILRSIAPSHSGVSTDYPADERKIWPQLYRNGVLPEFANSFLVLAGASGPSSLAQSSLLAAGYVMERRPCFNIQTHICIDDRGKMTVAKSRLTPADPPAQIDLIHQPGVQPYCVGPQLEDQIIQSLQHGDLNGALAGLRLWIDHVIKNGLARKNSDDLHGSLVLPEFFDCTPRNLIIVDKNLQHIDQEWRYTRSYTLRNHILRYLRLFTADEKRLLRGLLPAKPMHALQLCLRLDVPVSEKQYEEYKIWQHQLNGCIAGEKRSDKSSLWQRLWFRSASDKRRRVHRTS